ncbi:hypothetical protein QR680_016848 [Steinernema hermaphroditum]|uniref:TauD/TfdA-like domain-containing protein n=1 Tax=Steinernema hermaphroditum TaxID=289476 RepID=A0AA39HEW2_9BILA|nr:hypothetical protein QR680_016848 [Steinernema hermaphroditum]
MSLFTSSTSQAVAMISLKSARRFSKVLNVEWADGFRANFSYVWLRDSADRTALVHLELTPKPEAVDINADRLLLKWPQYVSSQFSSEFLRSHSTIKPMISEPESASEYPVSLNWHIVHADSMPIGNCMGSIQWGANFEEIGTVWPHFEKIASMCAVESLNPSENARLYLVDSFNAVEEMAATHPEEFNFLCNCSLQYQDGPFAAAHKIVRMVDNKITSIIFNNVSRSAEVPSENVEKFYSSLQLMGRFLWRNASLIELRPHERLVVNNHRVMVGAPAQYGRRLRVQLSC